MQVPLVTEVKKKWERGMPGSFIIYPGEVGHGSQYATQKEQEGVL